jgi:starch synthase
MNIVYIASEAVPFSKTGGLADVMGSLPKMVKDYGKVSVFIPYYSQKFDKEKYKTELIPETFFIQVGEKREGFTVRCCKKDGVNYYFIENEYYFGRPEIYGPSNDGYFDNGERFIFFSQACLKAVVYLKLKPTVLHLNDWQTGLVPAYIKTDILLSSYFEKTKIIFTIHNIDYQGIYPKSIMDITNIPWHEFRMDKLEFFDNVNFMKAGIAYSDFITTVSEKYSKEIQEKEWISQGLEKILKSKSSKIYGIVNGIDIEEWNPSKDKFLKFKYSSSSFKNGKEKAKKDLQEILHLPINSEAPVLAIISRLVKNKGFDIVEYGLESILDQNQDLQLIVIGTGETKYENFFRHIAQKYQGRVSINIRFANELAHKVYAGADMFLMASTTEACGLGQLISFRFGTIPIVNPVGGLFDTVQDFSEVGDFGTGFRMKEFSHNGLIEVVNRAIHLFKNDKKTWEKLIKRVMNLDVSWKKAVKKYIEIYKMKKENE